MNSIKNKLIIPKVKNTNVIMRKSISYDSIQYTANKESYDIFFNPIQQSDYVYREKQINIDEIIDKNKLKENVISSIELIEKSKNTYVKNIQETDNDIFIDIELDTDANPNDTTTICINTNANANTQTVPYGDTYNCNNYIQYLFSREKLTKCFYILLNFRLCGFNPITCIVFLPLNLVKYIKKNKIVLLNHLISIFLHIFLMIIFEIYFYFNYVIVIEKEVFLKKINAYFNDLNKYNHDKYSPFGIALFINETSFNKELETMYKNYNISMIAQNNLLSKLLYQSCKLASIFGLVLLIFWFIGLVYLKNIKWKGIIIDNVLMLGLLGCFEYIFFTTIIMNYNPITDAEIEYIVVKNIYTYVTSNNTQYNTTNNLDNLIKILK